MQKLKIFFIKNYQFLACCVLLFMILMMSILPQRFANATFNGLKVWANILLPSMFVFFVLTKLLVSNKMTSKFFLPMDKAFCKIYRTKKYGGYVFAISILAGYPVGAKIVSELYSSGKIGKIDGKKIISFCSTSSPMFILGSLGSGIFGNMTIAFVVLISHMLSSLCCGMVFKNQTGENLYKKEEKETSKNSINDVLQDSIISILMVGGYISLCFVLVEFLLLPISNVAENGSVAICIFKGLIEVTSGCVALSQISISAKMLAIFLSALVSFGGLCIHLQSYMFLKKADIKYAYFLKTKFVQTIFAVIFSTILSFLFLK